MILLAWLENCNIFCCVGSKSADGEQLAHHSLHVNNSKTRQRCSLMHFWWLAEIKQAKYLEVTRKKLFELQWMRKQGIGGAHRDKRKTYREGVYPCPTIFFLFFFFIFSSLLSLFTINSLWRQIIPATRLCKFIPLLMFFSFFFVFWRNHSTNNLRHFFPYALYLVAPHFPCGFCWKNMFLEIVCITEFLLACVECDPASEIIRILWTSKWFQDSQLHNMVIYSVIQTFTSLVHSLNKAISLSSCGCQDNYNWVSST